MTTAPESDWSPVAAYLRAWRTRIKATLHTVSQAAGSTPSRWQRREHGLDALLPRHVAGLRAAGLLTASEADEVSRLAVQAEGWALSTEDTP